MTGAALFVDVSQTAGRVSLALFAAILVAASVVDLRERRIPNALVIAGAAVWAVARVALGAAGDSLALAVDGMLAPWGLTAADGVVGALALGGGVLLVALAFEALSGRESMGGGDVKLLGVTGLFLGWERGLACLLAACVAVIVATVVQRALGRKTAGVFPFAPAILMGAAIAAMLP